MRNAQSFALMELSAAAFDEIGAALKKAGYLHAFQTTADGTVVLDMNGVAVTLKQEDTVQPRTFDEAVRGMAQLVKEKGEFRHSIVAEAGMALAWREIAVLISTRRLLIQSVELVTSMRIEEYAVSKLTFELAVKDSSPPGEVIELTMPTDIGGNFINITTKR